MPQDLSPGPGARLPASPLVPENRRAKLSGLRDPKLVADRYVTRGGGSPNPSDDEIAGDVVAIASYLLWDDRDRMMGGYRCSEAFDAFCRLLRLDRVALRKAVGPDALARNES